MPIVSIKQFLQPFVGAKAMSTNGRQDTSMGQPTLRPIRTCLFGLGLLTLLGSVGCQSDYSGQTLPSPWWMTDDIQYFPAGPEFKLSREAAAMNEYGGARATPRAPAPIGPPGPAPGAAGIVPAPGGGPPAGGGVLPAPGAPEPGAPLPGDVPAPDAEQPPPAGEDPFK